ncbi:TetR/AcrR family transcriptional regulator [Actinoplanes oblitus]|uniref:TetR/AcrR family transcriptional regulator n=1 Tax=Actinoplanes oblitus TaxID=3040509 RepID=A0ABY8WH82_9ACTN|nr:TetR/AcrR family transcriptional regulator [Actinoplanes oblitus]WIM95863.1 TetR/AcrR family transcriptional regulator [Actinoplanes oblitus]
MTQPPRVDGRTARSERTRNAIVDAHLRLIRDGDLRPTADRIAKLAGVSLRALWSHFADMESLMAASGQRVLDERDASYRQISPELPLAERIDAFCRQRARMLEEIGPAARASALKEPFSIGLQRYRRLHVARVRDELTSTFPEEIGSDEELLNALTTISLWPAWSTLREAMELPVESARAALARGIRALLGG